MSVNLADLANAGSVAEKLPAPSRRTTNNPFVDKVAEVAHKGIVWTYPPVSGEAPAGEKSDADKVEAALRQAGNALDRTDKANGGPGWRIRITKVYPEKNLVQIAFRVEKRGAGVGTPLAQNTDETSSDAGEMTVVAEASPRRSRR